MSSVAAASEFCFVSLHGRPRRRRTAELAAQQPDPAPLPHPPLRHYDPDALPPPFVPAPLRTPVPLYPFPHERWGEGEPGPSSLARYRRPDSLSPARPPPHFDAFGRSNANFAHHSTPRSPSIPSHLLISINSPLRVTLLGRRQFPLPLHHRAFPWHTPPPPPFRTFRSPDGSYARSESYADLFNTTDDGPAPRAHPRPSAVGPSPPRRLPPPERMPLLERRRWHATSAEACFYIYLSLRN